MSKASDADRSASARKRMNQNGQRIGAKGQRTRQRLIEVTVDLLRTRGLRDLTVAEVARVAQTSPATFYVYFPGVPEVVLGALEGVEQSSPRMLELLDDDWIGDAGLARAEEFVGIYCDLWQQHAAIFRTRNLASEEGDPRFRQARIYAVAKILQRLADRVQRAHGAGRVAEEIDSMGSAGAILILLERLAAVAPQIGSQGPPRFDDVKRAAAHMVAHALGAA